MLSPFDDDHFRKVYLFYCTLYDILFEVSIGPAAFRPSEAAGTL